MLDRTGSSIRAIISNPIYKGVLRFGDELSPPFENLRIVSDEEFDCCEALVKGRAPERPEKPVEPDPAGLPEPSDRVDLLRVLRKPPLLFAQQNTPEIG